MNGYISNAIDEDEDNYDETVYAAINKVKNLLIIVLNIFYEAGSPCCRRDARVFQ